MLEICIYFIIVCSLQPNRSMNTVHFGTKLILKFIHILSVHLHTFLYSSNCLSVPCINDSKLACIYIYCIVYTEGARAQMAPKNAEHFFFIFLNSLIILLFARETELKRCYRTISCKKMDERVTLRMPAFRRQITSIVC